MGDLLTSYNGVPITYDGIGNPLNDGTWTYTWQHGRQLASMNKLDGSAQWSFTYNADGLRTQRTNGTRDYCYTYLGGQLTHMTVDDHTLYFAYDAAGTPLSLTYDGETYYYVTNLQGDVVSILNSSGAEVVAYAYDAWGNLVSTTCDEEFADLGFYNPLRYRGYVYDEETELYYLQSRYYNPEMGRFINADGAYDTNLGILGYNMYAYCMNNPVDMYDPDGACSKFLGFLWKIDCKQASCSDSKNYVKPKAVDPIGSYNKGRGYVYVVTEDQLDIMEEKEKNVVVIVDKRSPISPDPAHDPNMQILDSYRITNTNQQKEIAQLMLNYNTANPVSPAWNRTLDSLVLEWEIHNNVYRTGFFQINTKDCDFNNGDEGKGYWDFFQERVLK